jgi:diacylglycerol kinase (ATP)
MNPKSGKTRSLKDKKAILDILKNYGDTAVYLTTGQNDRKAIRRIKEEQPDIQRIVVCGGDGTLNVAMNGLHVFEDLEFIFLPYGSVNIFAKENGYPRNNIKALSQILDHGKKKKLYPGIVNNKKTFLLMNSVGFDSFLVYQVESVGKKWRALSYLLAFVRFALQYDFSREFKITVDEKTEQKGNLIIISNCKKYGGFIKFTPDASFFTDDLQAFVYRGNSFFSLIKLFFLTVLKLHIKSKKTAFLQGRSMKVEGEGHSQMDGEIGMTLPVEIHPGKGVWFVLP